MKKFVNRVLNWLLFWKKAPEQIITQQEMRVPLMRIIIERHPNPVVTTYHLDRRLSESQDYVDFEYNGGDVRPGGLFSVLLGKDLPVEPFTQSIAERLYTVPGVTDEGMMGSGIKVGAYEIRVGKARAFDDIEIETGIIAAIAELFGLNVEDIGVTIDSQRHLREYYQRMDAKMAHDFQ